MATLQRIRNHSVALLVIVGLAMAAFIVGDLLTSSSSIIQSSRDKVVTINGKKVTYEEFEAARQRKQDFIKAMQGQELDNNASQQLTQQVYTEFITKALIEEIGEKYGFAVTKAETNELIQGSNLSPVLGQMFGQQAPQVVSYFVNLITNDAFEMAQQSNPFFSYNNWMEIEDQVVLNREVEKYMGLISAAIKPNKLEAQDNFNGDNTECSFAYVRQSAIAVADSLVKVSSDDIKKYYESTKRNYKIDADRRAISFISVNLVPSELDYAEAEADIKALREEFATTSEVAELVNGNSTTQYLDAYVAVNGMSGDLKTFVQENGVGAIMEPHREQGNYYMMARIMDKTVGPDSIQMAIVVVPTKAEADSIYDVLAKASSAEEALAAYSDQQKFIGWMQDANIYGNFGPEVRDEVRATANGSTFNKAINETTNLVCKVLNRTKNVDLAKVAVYATEVIPSTRTRGEEYGKLNRFITAYKTPKAMADSARSAGFMMMPFTLYSTSYNVGGIQDARQAVRFAFQGKKGDVSEIFETGDNLLVVAITGDVENGYMSLNDTTFQQQLSQYYVAPLKKVEYLAGQFAEVTDKNLATFASKFDAKVDTAQFVNFNLNSIMGLGSEPKVLSAALKANEGDVITVAGQNSVVALQVLSKNNKGLEYNEAERLAAVARTSEYAQATQAALAVLQNNAKIEDNRINFY